MLVGSIEPESPQTIPRTRNQAKSIKPSNSHKSNKACIDSKQYNKQRILDSLSR